MRPPRVRVPAHVLTTVVKGTPVAQGSKNAFVIPNTNRASVSDSNAKELHPWRNKVKAAAVEEMDANGAKPIEKGIPVKVTATFFFKRPKSHYGTGRNAEVLKNSAELYKPSTPDLDKLQRAIGDALTGVVYADDGQIAIWETRRVWAETPRVAISVYAL